MKIKSEYRVLKRSCRLIRKISPGHLELSLFRALLNAVLPYIAINMSALIIDELTTDRNPEALGLYVFISVFGTAAISVINLFLTKKISIMDSMFLSQVKLFLNSKRNMVDYITLENPEYSEAHAKILEIIFMTNGGIVSVNRLICTFIQNSISLVMAFCVFIGNNNTDKNGLIYLFITVGIIVVSVFGSVKNARIVSEKEYNLAQNSSTNKYLNYYHYNYMEDDKAGKDIHIFNQKKLIIGEVLSKGRLPWMNVLIGRYNLYQKYYGRNTLISVCVGGYAYIYIGLRALKGYISLGSVAQCYSAITLFSAAINELFITVSQIKSNNKYLIDFFKFIDTPVKHNEGSQAVETDIKEWKIECHNVSFKYPGSDEYAIRNVSMVITPKKRIAFVGMNGSGKTTMIKLLLGFYQPEEGTITFNGKNIDEYVYEEYLKLFSVVFQDFKLFSLPIGENVAASYQFNKTRVWDSLKIAGMDEKVRNMPLQLEQFIYKYVDEKGEDFSGGEEQKIAIARAHYRDAQFVLMDEPTASLDPVSEYEIYCKLNEIVENRGVIFISHRLSSCRFCDQIFVFDNGRIVQEGKHNSLLNDGSGKYRELWNAQAQYYV